jgi:hypothetical protein
LTGVGAESLAKKRKKYANLITPTLLSIDFFSSAQDIRLEDDDEQEQEVPHIEHEDFYPKKTIHIEEEPKVQTGMLFRSQTFSPFPNQELEEEEKIMHNKDLGESHFESISIDFSHGPDKMMIEDENKNKKLFLREEILENFEYEELDFSGSVSHQAEEDLIIERANENDVFRTSYKVIGNEVFEYEEI